MAPDRSSTAPRRRPPIRLRWRARRPGPVARRRRGSMASTRAFVTTCSLGDRMADMQCIDGIGPQDPGIRLPDRGIVLRQFNGGIAALNFARAQHLVVQSILLARLERARHQSAAWHAHLQDPGSQQQRFTRQLLELAPIRARAAAMARIADFPSSPGGSPATPVRRAAIVPRLEPFDADDALAAFRELKASRRPLRPGRSRPHHG